MYCYCTMKQVDRRFGPIHRAAFREAARRKHLGADDHMPVGRSIPEGEIGWSLLVRDGRGTSSIQRGWIKRILWYNNIIVWKYSVWINNKPLLFLWSLQLTYPSAFVSSLVTHKHASLWRKCTIIMAGFSMHFEFYLLQQVLLYDARLGTNLFQVCLNR